MPANTSPVFVLTPICTLSQVSVANTNRDGTGDVQTAATGATNGTRINRITIKASVTTTSGMVRFYIYNGSVTRLWREYAIGALTPSATVQSFMQTIELFGERALILPVNYELRVSTEKAEAINIIVEGGNY